MFLPRRRLDRRNDLPRDAQLGECAERRELILAEITNRLKEADHALLHDILTICTDEEVGTCF